MHYCRFQISFQFVERKFVVNFLIEFPNVEVCCELRSELRKFIANFKSTFGDTFAVWVLTTELYNTGVIITYDEIYLMKFIEMSELDDFLNGILPKVGDESCAKIRDALKANNFTSRLSLKLLNTENLDALFADAKLPLGSRKVLEYHLELLKDESPLVVKSSRKKININVPTEDISPSTSCRRLSHITNDKEQQVI